MGIHQPLDGGVSSPVERRLELDGAAIKAARKAAGLSQADLARLAGVGQPTVCRIETGAIDQTRVLPQIVRALGGRLEGSHEGSTGPDDPEARRPSTAFRDLESIVGLLSGASSLLALAVAATITTDDRDLLQSCGLRTDSMPGWRLHALTPERSDALHHALLHVQDVVKELERQYYAELDAGEVAA